eukprot:scaffold11.g4066.t1
MGGVMLYRYLWETEGPEQPVWQPAALPPVDEEEEGEEEEPSRRRGATTPPAGAGPAVPPAPLARPAPPAPVAAAAPERPQDGRAEMEVEAEEVDPGEAEVEGEQPPMSDADEAQLLAIIDDVVDDLAAALAPVVLAGEDDYWLLDAHEDGDFPEAF